MMKFGYARIDSINCDLENQIDRSLDDTATVFVDEANKPIRDGVGFKEMLQVACPGDCIVVTGLDQLANSVLELRLILIELGRRRLTLTSISERLNSIFPDQIFPVFQAISNFKQQLYDSGSFTGLVNARRKGLAGGRRPVLTEEKSKCSTTSSENPSISRRMLKRSGCPCGLYSDMPAANTKTERG